MAAKPTIYRMGIALTDMDRDHYASLNLTVAQHPSETIERMMVRVLAYCFNAQEGLELGKGLSDTDEPALWVHSLDGSLRLWIEVGEPSVSRVKKAVRVAPRVKVYCFNSKAPTWWSQGLNDWQSLDAEFYRFDWQEIVNLAAFVERTMDYSVTITDEVAFVATTAGSCEVNLHRLEC